jgi:NAD(P)-dependent dehydrogenase (short-subunit alcohol dehydrogenase family)
MPAAVVTGAGRGLGRALCAELVGRGWDVLALVRRTESADDLAAWLGSSVCPVVADVADDTCAGVLAAALEPFAQLELLVNNAGIVRVGPALAGVHPADVLESLDVHCVGALRVTQAVLPWLLRAPSACIVNVSSRRASLTSEAAGGVPGSDVSYAYRIAKAAQNMLTVCLSRELAETGVDVLAVHPGALLTDEAPPDAALEPALAARRILDLAARPHEAPGLFVEPPDRVLSW